jgi:hypothetical protein
LIPSAFLNTLYADVKFRFTIIAFLVVAAVAQTGAERITPIAGRIVNAQTRDPVRRVVIEISGPNNKWHEFSDGEGHFRFLDLKPGEYELIAHRDGLRTVPIMSSAPISIYRSNSQLNWCRKA